ncbi:MAG: asparagine synthase (glutamine-hydrolyzing) [Elusimicrobia bacterium]|nr:asparagine synthase (glutamine-hydrolyzing) [Elusimicrobiota bacterium]
MCGICGFTGAPDKPLLERMTARIQHRGPDSCGFYAAPGVNLGMRRLSIIDLSTGEQPIGNEDGTVWTVFNGEIYNYRELRAELSAQGHVFRTASDTEVLVHLYEQHGAAFPSRLRGMFAFALWDTAARRLLVSRDQLGIKPLYYAEHGGELLFASELKSLLARRDLPREVDPEAIDAYMTLLNIPAPRSVFKAVKKLPAGHSIVFENGGAKVSRYWTLPSVEPAPEMPESELRARFLELFDDTVEKHMLSDVPLGVFLSGGIDSSAIAASMARVSGAGIKTFSLGFEDGRDASYNELDAAALTAKHLGSEHRQLFVKPDFAGLLPKLAWHLDEPFADSSAALTYLISKEAVSHVKVALTGIGGDELFMGYPRYLGMRAMRYFSRLPASVRRAFGAVVSLWPESEASGAFSGRAKRFAAGALKEPLDCYLGWISFLDARAKAGLYARGFVPSGDALAGHRNAFAALNPAFGDYRFPLLDVNTYLSDDLLVMGDKMSMAASLELRVPFCDTRLLEFAMSLGAGRHLRGERLKSFLKSAVAGRLPPQLMKRRKQGFMLPLSRWLKEELRGQMADLLSRESVARRGYFRTEAVSALVSEHCSGRANHADRLWALMMLEQWHRTYADGGSDA